MPRIKPAFKPTELMLPIASLIAQREIAPGFRKSATYRQIAASLEHVGLIEPVVVFPKGQDRYLLLDGHVRIDILASREVTEVRAIIATDNEAYTYNKRVNHAPAIAQHFMILKALEYGVSEERIAQALDLNIAAIRQRRDMLDGICPEAVEILKTKGVTAKAFAVLRKMKPLRQIEASDHMIAHASYSVQFAKFLLSITPPEMLLEPVTEKSTKVSTGASAMLQQEMEALLKDFKAVEQSYGTDILTLTVICGYVGRLLGNAKVERYLTKHQPDILSTLRSTLAETKTAKAQKIG
ncbi:MAG TPA: plasmid partitioning protein RepB C-terminal domain-containing protein [Candidatus Angelobacter sp.]